MKIIKIDAAGWLRPADFYDALLPLLGAPKGHGKNLNALTESMVWGGINSLAPPYTVQVSSTNNLPPAVLEQVTGSRKAPSRDPIRFQSEERTGCRGVLRDRQLISV